MPKINMHIPFLSIPDVALTNSAQNFIPISSIEEGLVLYKSGGAGLVMEASSLNFTLLSEKEQEAVIFAYAGLLNSLNFPIQIVVRSMQKDITRYMNYLIEAEKKLEKPKLAKVLADHRKFITEAIKRKNVLSKNFYIVILFTPYELGITKSLQTSFSPNKSETLPFPKSYVLRKAKTALYPKRNHLIRQAGRLGIRLTPLTTEELVKLFYTIYNPDPPTKGSGLPY